MRGVERDEIHRRAQTSENLAKFYLAGIFNIILLLPINKYVGSRRCPCKPIKANLLDTFFFDWKPLSFGLLKDHPGTRSRQPRCH